LSAYVDRKILMFVAHIRAVGKVEIMFPSLEVSPPILICESQKTLRRFRILSVYDLDTGNKVSARALSLLGVPSARVRRDQEDHKSSLSS